MASKVLIVEDDPNTTRLVGLYLARDGHKVILAADGLEGLRLAREARPDLVVLDLMLPKLDGIEVGRALREESDVPVVMLTARVEEEDRLKGLNIGADDYVTKPFSPKELVARIRVVLRRTMRDAAQKGPADLSFGEVGVDLHRRLVHVRSEKIDFTPTEFRLLAMLIKEPERSFSREQIIDQVFGYNYNGFDRTVDAHVSNIRRKIGRSTDGARYIHSVYGIGYRFDNE